MFSQVYIRPDQKYAILQKSTFTQRHQHSATFPHAAVFPTALIEVPSARRRVHLSFRSDQMLCSNRDDLADLNCNTRTTLLAHRALRESKAVTRSRDQHTFMSISTSLNLA